MASITIKDVPKALHERLKRVAVGNRRSLGSEIIVCLERALEQPTPSKAELMEAAAALRKKLPWVDHQQVEEYKRAGRP